MDEGVLIRYREKREGIVQKVNKSKRNGLINIVGTDFTKQVR